MHRLFVILVLAAFSTGGIRAQEEVLRAVPVDPAELTPERGTEPQPPQSIREREMEPLDQGQVELKPLKKPNAEQAASEDSPGEARVVKGPQTVGDLNREDAVRLQIFLDESLFGPGVIDGRPGRFTKLAVEAWNEVNGYGAGELMPVLEAARREIPRPFAEAIVPEVARKWVDPNLPYKKAAQAQESRMSYRSFEEFMSERYHTDVDFLAELNGDSRTYAAAPGRSLVVPNVAPFVIEQLTGARYESESLLKNRRVVIDTKVNQVRIYEPDSSVVSMMDGMAADEEDTAEVEPREAMLVKADQLLVASFPITPGQERFIKYGTWTLKNCVQLPTWRYDQSLLDTGRRSDNALNIPPGPNSPVGIMWAGLSVSGIGMHGTSSPETIGRSRSAGCIRLANWDVMRLPDLVRPGSVVEIR